MTEISSKKTRLRKSIAKLKALENTQSMNKTCGGHAALPMQTWLQTAADRAALAASRASAQADVYNQALKATALPTGLAPVANNLTQVMIGFSPIPPATGEST
ncbi:MAG: PPE domain-containing protein [Candidatus Obscuribacterales bacterium]|nr:PPE domain-containing protein [Candidatus Obscuribacterales bacterium]